MVLEQIKAQTYVGANRRALIIGISDYADPKIPNLSVAESDAQLLYDTLTNTQISGFPAENVMLLLGNQATSTQIKKALASLRGVEEDDLVVIFFLRPRRQAARRDLQGDREFRAGLPGGHRADQQ
ncbi:MAG: caspase family protein [Phycisphaeraceae bacterium]|nr:caspase family protein [Phycisphaeraceae bacterium]